MKIGDVQGPGEIGGTRRGAVSGFRVGLAFMAAVNLGSITVADPLIAPAPLDRKTIQFAVGGDLSLGGRMNAFQARYGPAGVLADEVPQLRDVELAVVNLESVVSTGGVQGVEKGEVAPFYFRGRPETLAVLEEAGIDGVTTANNHSGDYGSDALNEQRQFLDRMGIRHPGSGADRTAACQPALLESAGIRVALFSVDTTLSQFAAGADNPGTCFIPLGDHAEWERTFLSAVADARTRADVVLFYVSWGPNFATRPTEDVRRTGRLIIDMGVDAIIGTNAHRIQGLEVVKGRPIIYDAGTLLFDFLEPDDAVLWVLTLSKRGVEAASAVPLVSEPGRTRAATPDEAQRIDETLSERSEALGVKLESGAVRLDPPPRDSPPSAPPSGLPVSGSAPQPLPRAPAACAVESMPVDIKGIGARVGPLTLLGMRVEPDPLSEPALLWVESYWSIQAPVTEDLWLAPRAYPSGSGLTPWGDAHQPCDWQWPVDRWEPGVIYRDRYPLRPSDSILELGGINALLSGGFLGPLEVKMGIEHGGERIDETDSLVMVPLGMQLQLRSALVALFSTLGIAVLFFLRRRGRGARPRRFGSGP